MNESTEMHRLTTSLGPVLVLPCLRRLFSRRECTFMSVGCRMYYLSLAKIEGVLYVGTRRC